MENSSTSTTTTTTTSSIPNSLRLLNKSSHKISKPLSSKPFIPINTSSSSSSLTPNTTTTSTPTTTSTTTTITTSATTTINTTGNTNTNPQQGQQPQPPVYNINKNDFREVVQKLTGSPAFHHTAPAMISSPPTVLSPPPPPPHPPLQRPTISRLHRIRPPPLAELAPRPPQPFAGVRPPMSPLPPLPTVSAAVESPITAYMRRLRGEPPPASPLAFGCFPSPGTLAASSPTRLFPTSPGPVPSPRWREL